MILIDTDPSSEQPTGANIKVREQEGKQLVGRRDGVDVLFVRTYVCNAIVQAEVRCATTANGRCAGCLFQVGV